MVNTSFYSGIATAIRFISGFVVNKVIAVVIGPSGTALVSQFQNFIGITTSFATGGIEQGVVKYVAEVRGDEKKKGLVLSTSIKVTLTATLIVGVSIAICSQVLSSYLFDTTDYQLVILIFGLTVVLFGLNKLLMSILNGTGEIKKLVVVKISSNLFGLFITATCAYFLGLFGVLVALAISQSVVFFVSLAFVVNCDWFRKQLFSYSLDKGYLKKLLKYTLMAITSMVIPPMVQIGIRNHIIDTLSPEQAGYWDGLWKISSAYLGLITTTLSIYYLPKLSSLNERLEIRKELVNGYKIITPLLVVSILLIYLSRDYIILLLYSAEYMDMAKLFAPQFLGDFFKIMSWLVAYLMLAKAHTRLFIGSQVIFSAITYFLSIGLINYMGLEGVVWAHAMKYFVYTVVMVIIFRKYLIK